MSKTTRSNFTTLIKIADSLDKKGFYKYANEVDAVIEEMSESDRAGLWKDYDFIKKLCEVSIDEIENSKHQDPEYLYGWAESITKRANSLKSKLEQIFSGRI